LYIDLNSVRDEIDQLQSGAGNQEQLIQRLLQTTIPTFEKALKETQDEQIKGPRVPPPPPATAADLTSFEAYRAYQKRVLGYPRPEANLRAQFELTPEGHLGKLRITPAVHQALMAGQRKYTDVRVPVLAIYASPADLGPYVDQESDVRAAFEAYDTALTEAQAKAVRAAAASSRIVFLPHASHAIFFSNEADVLREMRAFIMGLRA
jgi:pimeloyl-ACP methyl ester carboxylesterase